ncbi:UNVERIFIED_CONTAM: hypothetical protein FKN15_043087 [Acipenser sinensis]
MEKLSAYAFPSDSDEFLPPTPPPVRLCQAFRSSSRSMTAPAPPVNLASTRRPARQERGSKRGSASQPLLQLHYKDWTTPKLLKVLFEKSISIPVGGDRMSLFVTYFEALSAEPIFPPPFASFSHQALLFCYSLRSCSCCAYARPCFRSPAPPGSAVSAATASAASVTHLARPLLQQRPSAQHGLNGHLPPQSQSRKRGKHSVHGGGHGGRSGTPQFFMAGSSPPWGSGHSVATPGKAGSLATPVEAGSPKTPGDGSSSGPSGGDGSSSRPSGGDGSSSDSPSLGDGSDSPSLGDGSDSPSLGDGSGSPSLGDGSGSPSLGDGNGSPSGSQDGSGSPSGSRDGSGSPPSGSRDSGSSTSGSRGGSGSSLSGSRDGSSTLNGASPISTAR